MQEAVARFASSVSTALVWTLDLELSDHQLEPFQKLPQKHQVRSGFHFTHLGIHRRQEEHHKVQRSTRHTAPSQILLERLTRATKDVMVEQHIHLVAHMPAQLQVGAPVVTRARMPAAMGHPLARARLLAHQSTTGLHMLQVQASITQALSCLVVSTSQKTPKQWRPQRNYSQNCLRCLSTKGRKHS